MTDYGYLQHGRGTQGPFRTERVTIKHEPPDKWAARFEGRWRRVRMNLHGLWIIYQGQRITIQIEGV